MDLAPARQQDAVPLYQELRRVVVSIAGSRFEALEGRNYPIFEPAWVRFLNQ